MSPANALPALVLLLVACSAEVSVPGTYSCAFDLTGKPDELVARMNTMTLGDCVLHGDGTFSTWMEAGGERVEMSGTWEVDGERFAMTPTQENGRTPETPQTIHGVVAGRTITLVMEKGGQRETMILERK